MIDFKSLNPMQTVFDQIMNICKQCQESPDFTLVRSERNIKCLMDEFEKAGKKEGV